jgi:DNA polymerase V
VDTAPNTTRAQAVASYVVQAAEKLRHQRQCSGRLTVFARTSPFSPGFYSQAAGTSLPVASNDTAVLLQAALPLVALIYRPHKRFTKAGVLLQDLQSQEQLQHHLLAPLPEAEQQRRTALMQRIDDLNRRYGRGTVQWAACGLTPSWMMRREQLSRFSRLCLVQKVLACSMLWRLFTCATTQLQVSGTMPSGGVLPAF